MKPVAAFATPWKNAILCTGLYKLLPHLNVCRLAYSGFDCLWLLQLQSFLISPLALLPFLIF